MGCIIYEYILVVLFNSYIQAINTKKGEVAVVRKPFRIRGYIPSEIYPETTQPTQK